MPFRLKLTESGVGELYKSPYELLGISPVLDMILYWHITISKAESIGEDKPKGKRRRLNEETAMLPLEIDPSDEPFMHDLLRAVIASSPLSLEAAEFYLETIGDPTRTESHPFRTLNIRFLNLSNVFVFMSAAEVLEIKHEEFKEVFVRYFMTQLIAEMLQNHANASDVRTWISQVTFIDMSEMEIPWLEKYEKIAESPMGFTERRLRRNFSHPLSSDNSDWTCALLNIVAPQLTKKELGHLKEVFSEMVHRAWNDSVEFHELIDNYVDARLQFGDTEDRRLELQEEAFNNADGDVNEMEAMGGEDILELLDELIASKSNSKYANFWGNALSRMNK
jgi:hypothetical protein